MRQLKLGAGAILVSVDALLLLATSSAYAQPPYAPPPSPPPGPPPAPVYVPPPPVYVAPAPVYVVQQAPQARPPIFELAPLGGIQFLGSVSTTAGDLDVGFSSVWGAEFSAHINNFVPEI